MQTHTEKFEGQKWAQNDVFGSKSSSMKSSEIRLGDLLGPLEAKPNIYRVLKSAHAKETLRTHAIGRIPQVTNQVKHNLI